MSDRNFAALGGLFALLLVVWLGLLARERLEPAPELLWPKAAAARRLVLERGGRETILVRAGGGEWSLEAPFRFPADGALIDRTLAASAQVRLSEPLGDAADPRFELAGPRALRLRAFSGDAQAPDADFRVGKEGSGYDAFFVAREGGAQVFEARGLGRDALDREPGQWADKRVCALAPDSVTSLELRGAAGRLAWVRSGEAWSRDPGGALATDAERAALIDPVLKALSALDAESVAPAGEETAPELEVEARVAGAQARVLRLSIGPADAEQLRPVRRDREPYVFRTGKRKLEPFFAARAADAVKAPARSPSKRGR